MHKHMLFKISMEKGILNIKLVNWPFKWECNCKYNTDSRSLDNWTKSLKIIENQSLSKSLCNYPGLITINCSIGFIFEFVDPFATNYIAIGGWWNKMPCDVSLERKKLFFHGKNPIWIFNSLCECSRFRNVRWEVGLLLANAILCICDHGMLISRVRFKSGDVSKRNLYQVW